MLSGLAPARRRFVLGVAGLLALGVAAALVAVLAARPGRVTPVAQDSQPPVLLVAGYGGSTAALEELAAALGRAGRETTIVTPLGDNTGDLVAQAEGLDGAVRETLSRTGASSVDVVGYSAGGVVARVWVRELAGGSVARRVVTLGSPHHGTESAALGAGLTPDFCPEACRQLAPDSDLLRGLNAGDETPAGPVWVSIWTTDDRVVVPADSGSLEGALAFSVQSVCRGATISHGDLPRAGAVTAMVVDVLGRAQPEVPAPSVCT